MSCILCFSRSLKNRITILSIYSFLSRTRTLSRGVVDFAQWRYPSMTLLHLESKTNRDVCVVVLAPTIDKQTKQLGIETKADRTRSQNGLAGVDDHAEQKKRQKEGGNKKNKNKTDQVWPGKQASKHVAPQSLKEDPPPRPSHLQVEEEKTLLISAGFFSGTPCIQPSTDAKVNSLQFKLIFL